MAGTPLSLAAVRAVALHAQGLATPPASQPSLDTMDDLVERLGCVQIDTLQMVNRSHYLVLWSRLGQYDPADFDRLVYDPDRRRLFEYWRHAASFIPLRDYRYTLPYKRWFRDGGWAGNQRWLADPKNAALAQAVLGRIREEGGLRAADFESLDHRGGTWWSWKPAKSALEIFYNRGELMIANRVNFQRVYDLPERVLPDWVDTSDVTSEEADRYFVERALKGLGICQPNQVAEYAYMKRSQAKPIVDQLAAEGIAVTVEGELAEGSTDTLIVHRQNLPLVEQAADGVLSATHTTFLSPFDSLFWARGRDRQFWNFHQTLEAYLPPPKRKWGYFSLPILHRGHLIGRFDPKLERKTGVLRLKALYLEPGIAPEESLVSDVAAAMRDFMAWHGANTLEIERSDPPEFAKKLQRAL